MPITKILWKALSELRRKIALTVRGEGNLPKNIETIRVFGFGAVGPYGPFRAVANKFKSSPPQRGIAILGGCGVDTSGGGVGTTARPPPAARPHSLPWLGWLACCALPWLGLAWACLACLACLALAWSSNNNSGGAAAAGRRRRPVVVAGPGQGKAGKTGPGQTKPRQGTASKPAKPRPDQARSGHVRIRNCNRVSRLAVFWFKVDA